MSTTSQEAVTYSIQSTHVLNGQMYNTTLVISVWDVISSLECMQSSLKLIMLYPQRIS